MFFLENSHLAYIAPSVIFYLVFIANYRMLNFYLIIFFTAISFMNASLTLYIGFILLVIFTILFKIKSNNFQIFFLLLLTFAVLISFFWSQSARVKLADFKSTLNLNVADKEYLNIINENRSKNINIEEFNKTRDVNKKINLSSEIFRTSIIISKKALYNKPLGYGFNNYNQAFEQFINEVDIYNWEARGLNIKDASNNFSKIVTEFGIFSLFFFYLVISFFFSKKIDNKIKIFLILPIIIQLFIRGSGYFNGGFFLFCFFALSISIKNFKTSFKN
jgi:hypothetical protein